MSEELGLEFESPAGERLRFEWDESRLAELQPEAGADPAWRLSGELDWDEIELVRVLSARLEDGRSLALVSLRPSGAAGHGEELTVAALGGPDGFEDLDESLLSTEYGPDGLPRRIGLELYRPDGGAPIRVAADAGAASESQSDGVRRVCASLRTAGGGGVLDLLSRA